MANRFENKSNGGFFGGTAGWLWALLLVLAVVAAYQPVWKAGYIWDDDAMLMANGCVVGPFGLKEIWTTAAADICPFTLTTLWLENKLWGLNPLPYHLVNVFFHAASAVLLWQVLRRLKIPGALLGAALWALHPVQVESVAWISEMKNTESGFFYLLAIFFFIEWKGAATWRNYALMLLFAALAMTSKSSTVILPVELCLCAWWMNAPWLGTLKKLAPLFIMALLAGIASIWTQHVRGAENTEWIASTHQHLATAGAAVWFYLGKLLWPYPLMMIYPKSAIDPGQPFLYLPLVAVLVALGALWYNRGTWGRPWFFAFAYFLIALLPVMGFANNTFFEYSPVFDHFQYLASMGPLALAAAGIAWLVNYLKQGLWLQSVMGTVASVVLATLTWQYAHVFQNEGTLWSYMITKDPKCWPAYTNLAIELTKAGRPDDARAYFEKALELNPGNPKAENDMGTLLDQKGQVDEAVVHFKKAIAISPLYPHPHQNLGNIWLRSGKFDEALAEYREAMKSEPNNPDLLVSMGVALAQKGEVRDAMAYFEKTLSLYPDYVEANYNLGNALLETGDAESAVAHFRKALEKSPADYRIHNNLGRALAQLGQVDDAIAEFRKAAENDPNNVAVHQNLGRLLADKGRVDEAITELRKSLALNDHDARTHNYLGNALLQKGQVDEAMDEYQKSIDIDPTFAEARRNLGFAYFKKGRLSDAIYQYDRSLALNPDDAAAHNNLGIILGQQGKLEDALTQFEAAVQLKSDYDDAQKNLLHVQGMIQQKANSK